MRKRKKNSMNWLFNKPDALKAVMFLGARNITVIEAIELYTNNKEEVLKIYDKMVMYDYDEANIRALDWINQTVVEHYNKESEGIKPYVYFRFKVNN